MNFLAHLHLAEPTPASRMGNLLGDFVRGRPWDDRFPRAVWQGIMEHRYVDSFTDSHSVWQDSRALLPDSLRRYAGIIIDVYYDYFLHRHWDRYSSASLSSFIREVHHDLELAMPMAPPEAEEAIRLMIDEEWLQGYGDLAAIRETLERIAHRSPVLGAISGSGVFVEPHLPEMEGHFLNYYPDLIRHVAKTREQFI